MDITKHGWKCDLCGREKYDGDFGYKTKFKLEITTNEFINSGMCGTYEDVCYDCIEKINDMVSD